MTIDTIQNGNTAILKLSGRLDSTTSAALEETLPRVITAELTALTMDLTEVDYISSRGLRVLVAAYKQLGGREMTLQNPNASVLEVLRLSGLLKVFTIRSA